MGRGARANNRETVAGWILKSLAASAAVSSPLETTFRISAWRAYISGAVRTDICCKRMEVRANISMRVLLGPDAEAPERVSAPCPPTLVSGLRDGFKEADGCVVPQRFEGGPIWTSDRPRVNNRDDETGFECSLSKVHIEDFAGEHPLRAGQVWLADHLEGYKLNAVLAIDFETNGD